MKTLLSENVQGLNANLVLLATLLVCRCHAGPGQVDLSFDPEPGLDGSVTSALVQPDGKLIIAGGFTNVRGLSRTNLARLNADGSGDPTFLAGTNAGVTAIAFQPDGKLLVAGAFKLICDEWECYHEQTVIRLHGDGTPDASFTSPMLKDENGAQAYCDSLLVQPDGRVLLGGNFHTVNGAQRPSIARLKPDGTVDESFVPQTGLVTTVWQIALQSNGDVLIAGGVAGLVAFGWTNFNGVARLKANGDLDVSFNPGASLQGLRPYVSALAVQSDGKILVGGAFTNALGGSGMLRFHPDGSLDDSFKVSTGPDVAVSYIALQSDGKIIIADWYLKAVNGIQRQALARLHGNGALDTSFDSGSAVHFPVALVLQPNDTLVLPTIRIRTEDQHLIRLKTDGTVDESFDPGRTLRPFGSMALQADGKVLLGGAVLADQEYPWRSDTPAFVNGTNRYGRVRLHPSGRADALFRLSTFTPSLNSFFNPEDCTPSLHWTCYREALSTAHLVQADGKVLLGGHSETTLTGEELFSKVSRPFLARFSADGVPEMSFEILTNSYVSDMLWQSDAKLIVAGKLQLNGTNTAVARFNLDGTLDNSFQIDQTDDLISTQDKVRLALEGDGSLLVSGNSRIGRVNISGKRQAGLTVNVDGAIDALAVDLNGKVLLAGLFTKVNGYARGNIARLHSNGTLDNSFQPGGGPNGRVSAILLQPDGNILICGDFSAVDGIARQNVARLLGSDSGPLLRFASPSAKELVIAWPASASGFTLQQNTDFASSGWVNVTNLAVKVGSERRVTIAPIAGQQFFRLSGGD